MAHKESVQNDDLRNYLYGAKYFWNVSDYVGYGYSSGTADVLLVQFLLNADLRSNKIRYSGVNQPYLEMDGKFGGKTWRRIKEFQEAICDGSYGMTNFSDGMISPADGRQMLSPKRGIIYTIYRLNTQYITYFRAYFADIGRDPMFPSALRSHLYGPLADLV